MVKNRVPLQVAPIFRDKLKLLQNKININGDNISLRDLTEKLAHSMVDVECKILKKKNLIVRFDSRFL